MAYRRRGRAGRRTFRGRIRRGYRRVRGRVRRRKGNRTPSPGKVGYRL